MGNAKYVLPMLDALDRFTVQHDWFHETRMHRSDAMYRMCFGGFIQPLVVHMGWRGVAGDPTKRDLQRHEQALFTLQRALRIRRYS